MKPVQKVLVYIFGALCLLPGAALLIAPGRFLGSFHWAPIDPHLSRILGAALLALAWLVWRMVRPTGKSLTSIGAEVFFIFTFFSSVGLLRHVLTAFYPWMVWVLTIVLLLYALFWGVLWFTNRKSAEKPQG